MEKTGIKVAMIGLGKLGLPCAEVIATKHDVIGFDISDKFAFKPSFKIAATLDEALLGRDLVMIAVPTPHDPAYDGSKPASHLPKKDFDYQAVKDVLIAVQKIRPDAKVVLISTVLPGTVRGQLSECFPGDNLIYNPYFIAMGTVKEDFLNPEMLPIGTQDGNTKTADLLIQLYKSLGIQGPFVFGTWEEAEAIKVFYNTFISFKLSFVNMIQDVAQKLGHINVDVVTHALAQSKGRILSPSYMKAGMGDGGPCHPRDNIALSYLAERLDLGYDLFGEIMHSREVQAKNLAIHLASYKKPVCILGVAFKPDTHLVDGSYSLLVSYYLQQMGLSVSFYDPKAGYKDMPSEAGVFLMAHPHGIWNEELPLPKGSIIVDPWRTTPPSPGCEVKFYGHSR